MTRQLVILDDAPIVGGAELFAIRLGTWLMSKPDPWDVVVVCPDPGPFAARVRDAGLAVQGARFPDLTPTAAAHWAGGIRDMARVLREARSSGALLVANTARAQAFAAVARPLVRGAPAVVNLVHEQDTAARRSAKVVLGRVRRVVAVGANTAAAYERALPGQPIARLNNFLDLAELDRAAADRAPRLRDAPPVLGVLARLIPEKGLVELVEELAAVPDAWSALRIAGGEQDAAYAARLRTTIERLGLTERVKLVGHLDDLAPFFAAIDALVVPSTGHEGQPTVILEALAHRVPVVVRTPIWSQDFDGLPVAQYVTAADLGEALRLNPQPVLVTDLQRRFGPQQALDALMAAGRG